MGSATFACLMKRIAKTMPPRESQNVNREKRVDHMPDEVYAEKRRQDRMKAMGTIVLRGARCRSRR
jgi:hypothetical protein